MSYYFIYLLIMLLLFCFGSEIDNNILTKITELNFIDDKLGFGNVNKYLIIFIGNLIVCS